MTPSMNAHNEQSSVVEKVAAEMREFYDAEMAPDDDVLKSWIDRLAAQPSPVVKQNLTTQPAAAQEAVTIDADAYHAMNGELCDFAIRWRLDGDYLRCTGCNRPQLTNYAGEAFAHAGGCKRADTTETHPWLALRRIMRPMFAPLTAAPVGDLFVECRQCEECNHAGINDSGDNLAACLACYWSGMAPDEDRCPECDQTGCMSAACPKCGARYKLVASAEFPASTPAAPGIDLTSLVPAEREKPELMMATWHEVAGWNACVAEIRRRIDASPKGALNEQFGSAEGLGGSKGDDVVGG